MKNFVTFTLAAGVALTSASVVQAAGPARTVVKVDRATAVAPSSVGSSAATFDRVSFNRELTRISELLQPTMGPDSLLEEGVSVGKKSGTVWSF